jgi:hypothetical protein
LPDVYQEAKHPGQEILELGAWAMSHMGKVSSDASFNLDAPPEAYSDPGVYAKVREYTVAVRERHGVDFDVSTEPLDTETVMRIGQGKKHGRLYIANGAVDSSSVPSFSSVQAQSTSSSQPIHVWPTVTQARFDALQVIPVFTRRTLIFTHLDQICITETLE